MLNIESSDLGNVGTLLETGDVILYDAGSYYAHNEIELGIWRCQWGQFFQGPGILAQLHQELRSSRTGG